MEKVDTVNDLKLSTTGWLILLSCVLMLQCRSDRQGAPRQQVPAATEEPAIEEVPALEEEIVGTMVDTVDYDTSAWRELSRLDPGILLDLRYATDNNFVEETMYDCGRCFLRPVVAAAVVEAHRVLQTKGLGLKMYDCYRPRPIQWKLWKKVPDPRYVADPRKGSMHNRGMAVDLTIVDSTGKELDMGTDFDYFGKEAYHSYGGHSDEVTDNRQMLLELMEDHGFRPTSTEWWHYSYKPETFPIDDWVWSCEL